MKMQGGGAVNRSELSSSIKISKVSFSRLLQYPKQSWKPIKLLINGWDTLLYYNSVMQLSKHPCATNQAIISAKLTTVKFCDGLHCRTRDLSDMSGCAHRQISTLQKIVYPMSSFHLIIIFIFGFSDSALSITSVPNNAFYEKRCSIIQSYTES